MTPPGAGSFEMRVVDNLKVLKFEATMENLNFVFQAIRQWKD